MSRQPYDAATVASFFENDIFPVQDDSSSSEDDCIDLSDPEPTGDVLSDDDQSDLETSGRVPTSDGLSDPETTIGVLSDEYNLAPMDTEPPFQSPPSSRSSSRSPTQSPPPSPSRHSSQLSSRSLSGSPPSSPSQIGMHTGARGGAHGRGARGRARGRGARGRGRGARGRGRGRGARGRGRGQSARDGTRGRGARGRARGRGARGGTRSRGAHTPSTIRNEQGMNMLSVIDTAPLPCINFTPQRTPGPNLPASFVPSPLNYFLLFFDMEMIDEICVNSNTYAEIYRDKYKYSYRFYPENGLTRYNFYQFLSIVIFMGINPRSDYFSYWSKNPIFSSEFIQNGSVSRNAFSAILTFLHVGDCDPASFDINDRLHKVRNILDKLRDNCQKYFYPSQNISVDERMVKNKGRFSCKQYVRAKPVRWGFKLWVLADSSTGYTYNFQVYRGKHGETVSSKGPGFDVVMSLVEGLEKQGFIVYTDNFYSSPVLFEELANQGFGAVGTINPSRESCPVSLAAQKKKMLPKKCDRGYGVWIRKNSILYNVWKDTKVVCVASTVHRGNADNKVKRRVKKDSGGCEEVLVPIPNSIYAYNRHMGGVDLSDQLLQYHQTRRQTHKYWKTLFYHCVDIAVTNAYILYKLSLAEDDRSKYDHKKFVSNLIDELVLASSEAGHFVLLFEHHIS